MMQLFRISGSRAPWYLARFQPLLDHIAALRNDAELPVRAFLDAEAETYVARAPGRLDVMGGIADYSGATVLQLPLDCATIAVVQRQTSARCDLATNRGGRWKYFTIDMEMLITGELRDPTSLAEWFADRPDDHWAAYVVGVVQRCLQRPASDTLVVGPGLRMVIQSSVPEGKGVSSSAALEVASMAAVCAAYDLEMGAEEIAVECQWVENHVVGAPCGIMDQMTSACGRSDRLMRLRCQPGTIEGYVEIPPGYKFFGIDSGVRHAVTGADYGTVRTAAFMGYRMIADVAHLDVKADGSRVRVHDPDWCGYLANITPFDFAARFESHLPIRMDGAEFISKFQGITDPVTSVQSGRGYPVRQATAHPVFEQHRVERFAELLRRLTTEPGVAEEMGFLMYESHASYSACGLGSEGTNRLVELVAKSGIGSGLFGAKITGGGSGGTVAVFGLADAEPLVRNIAARYAEESGRIAQVFAGSGPSVDEIGLLVVDPSESSYG
jgi:galactokinase